MNTRWLAVAYIPIYFVYWRFISHSAIAASTHLVLFIAIYQPIEALQRAYRILTRSKLLLADALAKIETELGFHSEVSYFVEFVRGSKRGVSRGPRASGGAGPATPAVRTRASSPRSPRPR